MRAERRFAAVILLAFAAIDVVILANFVASLGTLYPDFFGTWSFARFAAARPVVGLYDQPELQAFQRELGPGVAEFFPFPYPPTFRLVLAPLGGLSFGVAYAAWMLPALAAYLWVGARMVGNWRAALALLVMPASTLCVVYGQSGFLTATLLLGAFLVLRERPVLAGVLLGLLTFKPQLGLLVPVALLAARAWRTIAAAVVTAALFVALSLLADGWAPWPAWIGAMELHSGAVEMMREKYARIMATPTAALMGLGVARPLATVMQVVASFSATLLVWVIFRRGVSALGIAALAVGTFVATPYAFVYDMPLAMVGAVLFLVERRRAGGHVPAGEMALVVFTALSPAAVFAEALTAPVVPLLLMALFYAISKRALQKDNAVA